MDLFAFVFSLAIDYQDDFQYVELLTNDGMLALSLELEGRLRSRRGGDLVPDPGPDDFTPLCMWTGLAQFFYHGERTPRPTSPARLRSSTSQYLGELTPSFVYPQEEPIAWG